MNCQANDLATPLLIAAQEGHVQCVEVLLAHGADPNLYCNEDCWQLPIHAAAQFSRLRYGSSVNDLLGLSIAYEDLVFKNNSQCDNYLV